MKPQVNRAARWVLLTVWCAASLAHAAGLATAAPPAAAPAAASAQSPGSTAGTAGVVLLTQETRHQECTPAGCRIARRVCRASGTAIGRAADGKLLVLSCAHGLESDQPSALLLPPEQQLEGRCVALSRTADLSLWSVEHSAPTELLPVADDPPAAGTRVEVLGFASGRQTARRRHATVRGYHGRDLLLDVTFLPGESGGAVLAGGRLVGVIWGTSPIDGRAVSLRAIQEFLLDALGYRPVLPAPHASQGAPHKGQRLLLGAAPGSPDGALSAPVNPQRDRRQGAGRPVEGSTAPSAPRMEKAPANARLAGKTRAAGAKAGAATAPASAFWPLVVQALGLAGPLGAGAALGGWILARGLSRGLTCGLAAAGAAIEGRAGYALAQARPPPAQPAPFAVSVDSPAPPQQVITETHFQPFERDTFQQAHCWAKEQFARKYPGAVEMLEALDSLIRQYLASKGKLHAVSK